MQHIQISFLSFFTEEGLPVSPHSKPITNSPSPTPLLSPSSQRSPLQDDDSSTSSSEITSRSDSSTSPPSSPSSSSSSSFSRKGSLQTPEDLIIVETWAREQCEAMCFILKIWLSLSGGLYERQDPKFFRFVFLLVYDLLFLLFLFLLFVVCCLLFVVCCLLFVVVVVCPFVGGFYFGFCFGVLFISSIERLPLSWAK